jgi:ABC-type glycerol-3-phosphate transport system permease component
MQAAALVSTDKGFNPMPVPVMPWPAEASAVLGPPRMSEKTPMASRLKLSKNSPPLDTVRVLLEVPDPEGDFARAGTAALYLPSNFGAVEGVAATVVPRTVATLTMRLLNNYASLLRLDDLAERGFFQWIRQGYPRWYMNSLFVALSTVLLGVFFDSLAAFAFAKFNFPFKRTLFAMLLATIMIPYPVTLVPTFFIFARMGFYNTYAALVVPGLVSAFGVFLVRQYMRTIPDDMIDAGRVDGASDFRVYWHIVLPAARPVLAALAVFRFIWQWNMYLFPLVLTNRDSMKTVQLGLATMQDAYGTVDHSVQMAGATLAVIPILVVYMLMQRHFISGITLGSVKE